MALTRKCVFSNTIKAAEALAANRLVDLSGAYPDAAGDSAYGVTASAARAGENVAVDVLGTAIVQSTAAAIEVGAAVMASDDAGKVVAHDASAKLIVGRAVTAVGGAGGLLEIALIPN